MRKMRRRHVAVSFSWNWPSFARVLLACAVIRYACNVLDMHAILSNDRYRWNMEGPLGIWRLRSVPRTTTSSAHPSPEYKVDPKDLWEDSTNHLPAWMIDYFRWHKEQRTRHDESSTTTNTKYLYVTCLKEYHKCGGAADRLLSLPFFVKIAASTQRLLLIQWTKPAALEEFLLPPRHGIDWRVPSTSSFKDLLVLHPSEVTKAGTEDTILQYAVQSNVTVLQIKFQSHDHGSIYYNSNRESPEEPDFDSVLRSVWRIFFTPAPALATAIEQSFSALGLRPGEYTAAHLRALYTADRRSEDMIQKWTQNSINCALQLQEPSEQKMPVFFASDSVSAIRHAKAYGKSYQVEVLMREEANSDSTNPLHIDKTPDWKRRPPSDFFAVFIDLYLMAMSHCVTFGMGGYGRFASLLSRNSNCSTIHMSATFIKECKRPPRRQRMVGLSAVESKGIPALTLPMFREPMPSADFKTQKQIKGYADHAIEHKVEPPYLDVGSSNDENLFPDVSIPAMSKLWEESKKLPPWMKDYFAWHESQRKRITEFNWRQFKYLVMTCLHEDDRCGGASDRLRPLPFIIRVAAESKRILLIVWERPAPLESFLLPPEGGVNWQAPDWIIPRVRAEPALATTVRRLVESANGTETIVKSRVQAHDHGSDYYNRRGELSGDGSMSFRKHYRDCWFSFFTPTPKIAKAIEDEMERLKLVPGKYAFAHLRALYGIEEEKERHPSLVRNWTRNSLNCASNLRPDGPFFFSSDSTLAKKTAVEYGLEKNTKVVTILYAESLQHLDFVPPGQNTNPSLYYPLFIDLYIMSMGRCYTYNVGGFGKWANLISGLDFTCNIRHWTHGVDPAKKSGCIWTGHESLPDENLMDATKIRPLFLPPISYQKVSR